MGGGGGEKKIKNSIYPQIKKMELKGIEKASKKNKQRQINTQDRYKQQI